MTARPNEVMDVTQGQGIREVSDVEDAAPAVDIESLAARIAQMVELAGGHPNALRIVAWARQHPDEFVSAKDMAAVMDKPLGTAAYHVRKAHEAGVLEALGTKRVRGAVQHLYILTPTGRQLADRLEDFMAFAGWPVW